MLALLVKCFKRRLTFTIGFSVTRNQGNLIVWNGVHHKSKTSGGTAAFGYPDPSYFSRVKQELILKGVNFKSEEEKEDEIDEVSNRLRMVQIGEMPGH